MSDEWRRTRAQRREYDGGYFLESARDGIWATLSLAPGIFERPDLLAEAVSTHLRLCEESLSHVRSGIPEFGRYYHLRVHRGDAPGQSFAAARIDWPGRTIDLMWGRDTRTVTFADFARDWVAVGFEAMVWPDWVQLEGP